MIHERDGRRYVVLLMAFSIGAMFKLYCRSTWKLATATISKISAAVIYRRRVAGLRQMDFTDAAQRSSAIMEVAWSEADIIVLGFRMKHAFPQNLTEEGH